MFNKPLTLEVTKASGAGATTAQWVKENKLPDVIVGMTLTVAGRTLADITSLTLKSGKGTDVEFPSLAFLLAYANRNSGDFRWASGGTRLELLFYPQQELFESAFAVKDLQEVNLGLAAGAGGTWKLHFWIPSVEPKRRIKIVSAGQNLAGSNNQVLSKGKLEGRTKSLMVVPTNYSLLRINNPPGNQVAYLDIEGWKARAIADYYADVAAASGAIGYEFDPNGDEDGYKGADAEYIANMSGADTNPVLFEQVVE
jgi:hypothetical protein